MGQTVSYKNTLLELSFVEIQKSLFVQFEKK